ncbi:MAG: hypothetical protein ACD_5C00127G0003 [uncultured bacterium]|nr:MAG: hypothetical protein ACD_5C00127G0003 [uncultured bacterium]
MIEKIRQHLYFKYGIRVEGKIIILFLTLFFSLVMLALVLMIKKVSVISSSNVNKNAPAIGGQIPGAPSGVRYINPPAQNK